VEFVKGHGTENDFVVLPDPAGALDLTEARVRALCDRRRGVGADGVLRVVRAEDDRSTWFMDYRNADGSIAEMCGNGVRVFVRYLVDAGLVDSTEFVVRTRAGDRAVVARPDGDVTVGMGQVRVFGTSVADLGGGSFPGVAVDVGNPHLACVTGVDVGGLDLAVAPGHDRALFPHGVNVEFVNVTGANALRMRVHERGVGETRSCGTGTVAAVASWLHGRGVATGTATVDVPGGRVTVAIGEEGGTLTGPAVLVARGELDETWWNSWS
jgi:diaminopimelate epimerase